MEKNGILLLISLCLGIFWGSCKAGSTFKAQDLNGKWTIVAVMGEPVTLENMPFLEFNIEEKRMHGNVGCNMLSAGFEPDSIDVTAFQLTAPVMTMMACIHSDMETKIAQAIYTMTNVQKDETPNRIKMVDFVGYTLLVLERIE